MGGRPVFADSALEIVLSPAPDNPVTDTAAASAVAELSVVVPRC